MIKEYLQSRKDEIRVKNIEMAAIISVHSVETVIQVALRNEYDTLIDGQFEDELTTLLSRYLTDSE